MALERPKPVAEQVNQILRERIRDKSYSPGDRLPSESDFAREFAVSRATIRTVLARLEVEGLIIRKQGDGTYVNQRLEDVNAHLGGFWEFSRLIESSGHTAIIQPLMVVKRVANAIEATALNIDVGTAVLVMGRIFLADDKPVIAAQNILPYDRITDPNHIIDASLPIREFLATACQREIAYAVSDIQSTLVDEPLATALARDVASPILELHVTFYDKSNTPLLYGVSHFDDTALKLRLVQAWG